MNYKKLVHASIYIGIGLIVLNILAIPLGVSTEVYKWSVWGASTLGVAGLCLAILRLYEHLFADGLKR